MYLLCEGKVKRGLPSVPFSTLIAFLWYPKLSSLSFTLLCECLEDVCIQVCRVGKEEQKIHDVKMKQGL